MGNMTALHRWSIAAIVATGLCILILNLAVGALKPAADIAWLDIAGEGGAALLSLMWTFFIFNSRPAGWVTRLLSGGLAFIFFSYWQDVLDEFIQLPAHVHWDHWVESGSMPLGMILLTLGIYHWHREQQAINRQLLKRERIFREHRSFDALTPLSDARYLREQLALELQHTQQPVSLIMIDLDCFDHSRRLLGSAEGLAHGQHVHIGHKAQLLGDRGHGGDGNHRVRKAGVGVNVALPGRVHGGVIARDGHVV